MISPRHWPVLALLSSCSIYDEALLDSGGRHTSDGGALAGTGPGLSQSGAGGGTGAIGGSQGTTPVDAGGAQGGDGAGGDAGGGSAGAPGGSGVTPGGSPSTGGSSPQPSGVDLLDDMEDGNFYLSPRPPRYGYWYVAGDETAGATLPKIEELVGALEPARDGSAFAVHFVAAGFAGWGSSLGFTFTDAMSKRSAYDAGDATGVSFWIRGSVAGNAKLRVLFPLLGSDPLGKGCGGVDQGECLDHYATQLTVTPEWRHVSIAFDSLHQAGWGVPLAAFDPGQMLGIEWSSGTADLDVWLDDLALIRPE